MMNFIRNNCKLLFINKNRLISIQNISTNGLIYSNNNNKAIDEIKFDQNILPVKVNSTYFQQLKKALGFQGDYRYPQPVLTYSSLRLYLCIQYQVDYDRFFRLCQMNDVMYSWCLITFLHCWMLSVPLMQQGQSGLFVRHALYKNMWKDIETRERKLKSPMNTKNKRIAYNHLNDIFRAFLFGFDEGLLSDDTILAGAIWRHLFEECEIKDYAAIAIICEYIRKNVAHLDTINEIDLLKNGIVTFVGFDQTNRDHLKERTKVIEKILVKETS
jgi:cytochrome b pre-mRNA-processing protein 3